MGKYRKKPVVIEAVRTRDVLHAATHNWDDLPSWLVEAYEKGDILFARTHVLIRTLEGELWSDPDDMIIRGVQGELYPCKPDIFEATYEKVEE